MQPMEDYPGKPDYVHGYTEREGERLVDQATALTEFLHSGTSFPAGGRVLEAGCGVGAQTVTLARNSPLAALTSVDISAESLAIAKQRVDAAGLANVRFEQADIFSLPYGPGSFDHVFVCFVLEHLSDPAGALACLRAVTRCWSPPACRTSGSSPSRCTWMRRVRNSWMGSRATLSRPWWRACATRRLALV